MRGLCVKQKNYSFNDAEPIEVASTEFEQLGGLQSYRPAPQANMAARSDKK